MYFYKTKKAHKYVKVLNYLISALKLFKKEQTNYKLVSDNKAAIINA
jgi:hypothetical protein